MRQAVVPTIILAFSLSFLAGCATSGGRESAGTDDGFLPMLPRLAVDPRFAEFDELDLSNMPTGDLLARHAVDSVPWRSVKGPEVRKGWKGEKDVVLRDLFLKVSWPEPTNKYSGTLFVFRDCENVTIENVWVAYMDPDYRAQHTFLFEGCGKVVIRNVYTAGAVERTHIRFEGCAEYHIERVEVSGWEYGENDIRCGAGIHINNGITRGDTVAVTADNPRELQWGVIRDSWFHDYLNDDGGKWRNQDGIGFHAPSNGIVFNCVFDNWLAGDGAIDDSHRRHDPAYHGKVHRIERCVFRSCRLVKTNGATGSPDCVIVWMNNLYVDSWLADYHKGWTNWHLHETHVFSKRGPVFVKNWGMRHPTLFVNNLLIAPEGMETIYWQSGKADKDGYRQFRAKNTLYLMSTPTAWMRGLGKTITSREEWLAEGLEQGCRWLVTNTPGFALSRSGVYRLEPSSPAAGFGTSALLYPIDRGLLVARDFYGRRRPIPPAAGAFEPAAP